MTCGTCDRHVMRAIEGMTGVTDVDVSLQNQQVIVHYLADWIDTSSLTAALRDVAARPLVHDIYTGANAGGRTTRDASAPGDPA